MKYIFKKERNEDFPCQDTAIINKTKKYKTALIILLITTICFIPIGFYQLFRSAESVVKIKGVIDESAITSLFPDEPFILTYNNTDDPVYISKDMITDVDSIDSTLLFAIVSPEIAELITNVTILSALTLNSLLFFMKVNWYPFQEYLTNELWYNQTLDSPLTIVGGMIKNEGVIYRFEANNYVIPMIISTFELYNDDYTICIPSFEFLDSPSKFYVKSGTYTIEIDGFEYDYDGDGRWQEIMKGGFNTAFNSSMESIIPIPSMTLTTSITFSFWESLFINIEDLQTN